VKSLAAFCAVAILYLGVGVFDHEVWSPTEPTVSGIVWNMVEHGEIAIPRINDLPYLEKPPLYYWLACGSAKLAGRLSPGILRLPAAVLGLLCLALVYGTVKRRHGRGIACVTLLFAATSIAFYEISHRASADAAALFFAFACFAIFARTLPAGDGVSEPSTWGWDVLFALVLACSFYAKNFFTFLVVLPPVVLHLLLERRVRRAVFLCATSAIFTIVLLSPWVLALERAGGSEYLRIVFFDNTFGRFFTLAPGAGFAPDPISNPLTAEKGEPAYFYLLRLPVLTLPWLLVFGAACAALLRRERPIGAYPRFLLLGFLGIPLVLSLSSSKVSEYLLPAFCFVPLIIAELLGELGRDGRGLPPWQRSLLVLNLALVGAALALSPVVFAVMRHQVGLLLLLVPALAAAAALGVGYFRRGLEERWLFAYGVAVALALAVVVTLMIPLMEPRKSYAPFFAEVLEARGDRPVVTTLLGDRGLPLITYYLRQRVQVDSLDDVLDRLRGPEPVLALIHVTEYERERERIDAIPGLRVGTLRGGKRMILLVNGADDRET